MCDGYHGRDHDCNGSPADGGVAMEGRKLWTKIGIKSTAPTHHNAYESNTQTKTPGSVQFA